MLANVLLAALLLGFLTWNLYQARMQEWLNAEIELASATTLVIADLGLACATTLVIVVLALRRPAPRQQDARWHVQVLCVASTFYVLLYERVEVDPEARIAQFAYVGRLVFHNLAALGLMSLGTSIALAPALRGIQVGSVYRFVRHPVYACYMAADLAFLVLQFSYWNLAIVWIAAWMFVKRAQWEEELLKQDETYKEYMTRVPYRFAPYII